MCALFKSSLTTSLTPQYSKSYAPLLPLLPLTTYLICSSSEAHGISGSPLKSWVVDYFSSPSSPLHTIVTEGSSGGYVVSRGVGVILTFTAPLLTEPVVDPTGAGDAFTAGFIKEVMVEGRSLEDGVRTGAAGGGGTVCIKGASEVLGDCSELRDTVRVYGREIIEGGEDEGKEDGKEKGKDKDKGEGEGKPIHLVLDYDRTLTCIEVGQFDLSSSDRKQVIQRVFGGPERLHTLESNLAILREAGVKVSILSMNSSHVIGEEEGGAKQQQKTHLPT